MVKHYEFFVATQDEYYTEYIGDRVKEFVAESGVQNGIVSVVTAHTNCGIMVTEPLDCILSDVEVLLHRLVLDDDEYSHAHFLPTYGRTSANAYGHLRSILVGNHTIVSLGDESCAWERRRKSYLWSLTVRRPERFLWM